MPGRTIAATGLALLLALARAGGAEEIPPDVAELRACAARNAPAAGRQKLRLERTDGSGHTRTLEAIASWKQDDQGHGRLLVRIEAPPDQRGAAFLLLARADGGNDLWTYLPDARIVRRITGRAVSGSFFASDFTYEDLVELQAEARHARIERLPDAELDGRRVAVLSAIPDAGTGSSYRRVVTWVDLETCVALRTDLYGPGDAVVKEMRVAPADLERQGEGWRPRLVTMRDLEKGSESRLLFGAGEWDVELPDRLFQHTELDKGA